ncbi:MAG: hypothetical protein LBK96_06495 [Prevotellaceae bacterium]|jgi:hypothetical protein|nr:hypothetical protein [Prevotellaceae bacterium]
MKTKSQKFIEKELGKFVNLFPEFRARYELNENTEAYFVEITPGEIFFQNDYYMRWSVYVRDRFLDTFPEEGLCFISENDEFSLKRIDFAICGEKYVPDKSKQRRRKFKTV